MSVSLRETEAVAAPRDPLPASNSPSRVAPPSAAMKPRVYDALVLLWVAVFHYVLGAKYRFAQIAYDEHYFLFEGWAVLKGQIPYKDFQEFKPPVIFFVNALGIQLFGLEGFGFREFLTLLSLASFLALTVALLSRRVHRVLVVAALMLMVNHFYDDSLHNAVINNAETLALDFFLLGIGVLLIRTRWERTQLFVGGLMLALSILSKEPMVFVVLAAWLSLLLLRRRELGRPGVVLPYVLLTGAGVATALATWLVYMLATDSLSWYVLQFELNMAYTENYAYQLRWASRTPKYGAFGEAVGRMWQRYLNPQHLAALIPFFVPLGMRWEHRKLMGLGALFTFLAGLYTVSIGRGFAHRYFIMAMAGTFFCVFFGTVALDALAKPAGHRWISARANPVRAAFLALALVLTLPRFGSELLKYASYEAPPPPVPQSDIDFVHAHTKPGDMIFTTDDPLLNVFSDRASAFRGGIVLDEIIEYYPGSTDEERLSIIRQGLEENRPKLVVFGNTQVGPRRKQRYTKALVMPFLNDNGYIKLNDRFYLRPD